jgi:hypothetical protein
MADNILTGEAARLFFAETGALAPCSACGGTSFELQDESISGDVYALPSHPANDGVVGGTQVVVVWCKDCGCIRLHRRKLIEDWLAQQ